MKHFVYFWHDKLRNMFYIGSHSGEFDDGYISSSRWLTAEINYRPQDFRRKIVFVGDTKRKARKIEESFLSKIKEFEFGKRYYNLKQGAPKGNHPWNKGKVGIYSEEYRKKLSLARKGKPSNARLNK
jgi:hypothetical protein